MVDTQALIAFYAQNQFYIQILLTLSLSGLGVTLASSIFKRLPERWSKMNIRRRTAHLTRMARIPVMISIALIGAWYFLVLLLPPSIQGLLASILQTIATLVWGQYVYRSIQFVLKNISIQSPEEGVIRPQTLPLLENLAAVINVLLIVYLIFLVWKIDMTAWLASAGIMGIAVGFAAKDTIANLLSGVFILADSPYKIGDYIVIDSGERGKVTQIGLRSTRLLTRDDLEINIPNAIIANGKIVNESTGRHVKSRVRVAVSVAYGSDIDRVKQLLMEVAAKESQICADPEPRVRFRTFGASGLDLELLVWIDDPEIRGRVVDSLNTAIYKYFNEQGIEIPYSKYDLYIKSMPGAASE